jgi:hypothetical protein
MANRIPVAQTSLIGLGLRSPTALSNVVPGGREAANHETQIQEGHARLKTKLGLPDLEHAKIAVIVSLRSFESQRSYRHSINEFVVKSRPGSWHSPGKGCKKTWVPTRELVDG